jgi:hypothetical protein
LEQFLRWVEAMPAEDAVRLGEQAAALVVAQRLEVHPGRGGGLDASA